VEEFGSICFTEDIIYNISVGPTINVSVTHTLDGISHAVAIIYVVYEYDNPNNTIKNARPK
jgi:hypothetical protein|tara:strand:- start:239 stop:421 length:183 start_codon:yes stop_codon:yes gene_type:complete